jgi:2-polyprenyl-3-methyl-5-hydroxy-6-metoxy-1,4-benzoquinol methylase
VIEIKFFWKTLQDEYSDDGPGLLRTPRIAEGILRCCTAEIAFCLILSPTPCPSLEPPHSPGCQRIEIGCGTGELLNGLHAARKMGLDVSLEQIARGKEQFPHLDLRTGPGETAVLPGGPFDVIILSDVLNYAADVEVLLRHLHTCSHRGHATAHQRL